MSWQDWSASELPEPLPPTGDLAEAKRRLDEYGYVVLANILSPGETEALRQRLHDQAAAERALGLATLITPASFESLKQLDALKDETDTKKLDALAKRSGEDFNEQFIVNLLNKGEEFATPLLLDRIQELTAHIIGKDFLLSSWLGSIVNPGCPLMGLHTDQWYMNQPHPRSQDPAVKSGDITRMISKPSLTDDPDTLITPSYSVQTIWMLTDFTEESGATRIIPKSNRSGVVPEAAVPHAYRSVAAGGPAGSVLLYDARLWHSSGEHRGDAARYALHGTFVGPQIRQMENYFLGVLPEVRRRLPPRMLEMLGYKIWWGYGRVDSLAQMGMIDPDRPPVGRLELSGA